MDTEKATNATAEKEAAQPPEETKADDAGVSTITKEQVKKEPKEALQKDFPKQAKAALTSHPSTTQVNVVTVQHLQDEILDLIAKHKGRELQQRVIDYFDNHPASSQEGKLNRKELTENYVVAAGGQANDRAMDIEAAQPPAGLQAIQEQDSLAADIMELPTTDLQRNNRGNRTDNRPGAYGAVPGVPLERNTTPGYHHLGMVGNAAEGSSQFLAGSNHGPQSQSNPQMHLDHPISGFFAEEPEEEPEPGFLVTGVPLGFLGKWQKPILALAGLSILAAIAVGITCGATDVCSAGGNIIEVNVTQAPTPPPTQSPTLAPTVNIIGGLPASTMEALLDPESPQALAYQWIMNDPNRLDYSYNRLVQRFALATLIYGMGAGADQNQTTDWLSYDVHECLWWNDNATKIQQLYAKYPGQPCSEDGQYQYLVPLEVDLLSGQIPPELGLLTSLLIIDLTQQDTSGTLPSELGRLSNMHKLAIPQATGTIPTEFGSMSSLEILFLVRCGLSGQIPTEIGRLSALRVLDLAWNFMNGSIPSQIGLLGSLEMFSLLDNGGTLNSTIPTQVGGLSSLRIFNARRYDGLSGQGLIGPIPSQFGVLPKLEQLELPWNQLTSTLPSELGLSPSLQVIDLDDVKELTGTLPTEIGMISTLSIFRSRDTNLYGTIPTEIGLLTSMTVFSVLRCKFSETVPTEIGLMKNLYHINLHMNPLRSTIPSQIGTLESLWNFDVDMTLMTGPIPSEVGIMKSLQKLLLGNALLTGDLPTQLGLSTTIDRAILLGNLFWTTIPTELGLMTQMIDFNIEIAGITGTIPSQLGMWQDNNNYIIGRFNDMTGPIPSEFGLLKNSIEIKFSENSLSGAVPTELGLLKTKDSPDARLNKFEFGRNGNMTGYWFGDVCNLKEIHFDCSDQMCGCWCTCPENFNYPDTIPAETAREGTI